jgi:hypothetical protein
MATGKASHIPCEYAVLAEFRFCRLGKHFMEPNDYEEIPLCKILYFVKGMGLLAWRHTIGQKMVTVQGLPCAPTHSYSHS